MRTVIIAEAGVNHNGDVALAFQLIDIAVKAGADAVKFQTFQTDRLVTRDAGTARYQRLSAGVIETQADMLAKLELSSKEFRELFAYCKRKGILFMSTPFDEESADMLDEMGMTIFKIPSGEIINKPLISHIASKKKPIVLSTGMSTLEEVKKAVGWIKQVWGRTFPQDHLTLLHCVSNYPARCEDVNLRAMTTMREAFGLPVGLSDHTLGIEVSVAAVALGAAVIEKHFTQSRKLQGPDHKASLEPSELKKLVTTIRNVEKAMGDGVKKPAADELEIMQVARRSLVTTRDIQQGEIIEPDDVTAKRPGTGIPPEFKDIVVGMQVMEELKKDTVLQWEYLKRK